MPDAKEISALLIAEQTTENDLLETSIPNAMTETGYVSRKITFGTLGAWIAKTLQFASDLHTTAKTIIGAINELKGTELNDTLIAGSTTLTFTDNAIVAGKKYDVYTDPQVWYTSLVTDITNHTATLTFPTQANDVDVTIVIK